MLVASLHNIVQYNIMKNMLGARKIVADQNIKAAAEKEAAKLCKFSSEEKTETYDNDNYIDTRNSKHIEMQGAKIFYDLGTSAGKVPLQAFLEYTSLTKCVGIEVVDQRFAKAEKNVQYIAICGYKGRSFRVIEHRKGEIITIQEVFAENKNCKAAVNDNKRIRTCTLWCGSLFDYPNGIKDADICNIAVKFPCGVHGKLVKMIESTKKGCSIASYQDISEWTWTKGSFKNVLQYDTWETFGNGWGLYLMKRI